MKLPDWNDDDALLTWVYDESLDLLWDPRLELFRPPPMTRAKMYDDIYRSIESKAIGAARAGNFMPLVEMRQLQERRGRKLSSEAEELIDRRLLGDRRVMKGRGVAKRSRAERERSPTFLASEDVPIIMDILRRHFTGRRPYKVRAQELAAKQWGIQVDRLINFMAKGRHL